MRQVDDIAYGLIPIINGYQRTLALESVEQVLMDDLAVCLRRHIADVRRFCEQIGIPAYTEAVEALTISAIERTVEKIEEMQK